MIPTQIQALTLVNTILTSKKNAVPRIIVDVGILQYNKPFQIILIFGDLIKQSSQPFQIWQ